MLCWRRFSYLKYQPRNGLATSKNFMLSGTLSCFPNGGLKVTPCKNIYYFPLMPLILINGFSYLIKPLILYLPAQKRTRPSGVLHPLHRLWNLRSPRYVTIKCVPSCPIPRNLTISCSSFTGNHVVRLIQRLLLYWE